MKKYIRGIFAIILYAGLTIYLGVNLQIWLQSIHIYIWPFAYWLLFFIIAFSFIIGHLFKVLSPLILLGKCWMFFFEYGFILCIISNILIAFTPLDNVAIVGSIIVSLLIILFIWGTYNAYSPVVRHLDIAIDKKGEPLKLVVASDFHLGILSNKKHLSRFVTLSNNVNPDVVLLVGDIVDDDPIWFVKDGMDAVMKQLKATYGVYGVLGNHEYYGGKIRLFVEEMKEVKVQILMDETILVGNRFYLTGQEDITNKKRRAINDLKPENDVFPWIVMNHTPTNLHLPEEAGVDLHLSGHTHRGQMWPNQFLTNKIFEIDYGYKLKGKMHTLVSSGFGFWGPPTRIGSRSEMWVVNIHFNGNEVL